MIGKCIPRKTSIPLRPWKEITMAAAGLFLGVIPGEVVKSIELSDNWDRWDALPIYLLRNPGLSARPVV